MLTVAATILYVFMYRDQIYCIFLFLLFLKNQKNKIISFVAALTHVYGGEMAGVETRLNTQVGRQLIKGIVSLR